MASNYPSALDAFASKSDGFDDVLAAHVNDLQDAMASVEGVLGINPMGEHDSVAARLDYVEQKAAGVAADTIFDAKGDLAAGTGSNSAARLPAGTAAQKLVVDASKAAGLSWIDDDCGVSINLGDGLTEILAGFKGWLRVPYDCKIESVALVADYAGSVTVDIWRSSSFATLPDSSMSICASSKPALASGQSLQNTTLSGWSTQLYKGDVIGINLDACSGIKLLMLAILGKKSALA